MYSFMNDYSEGAHPEIMKELLKTNEEQSGGYGMDIYTERAVEVLKEYLNDDKVDIHFLTGGTQTNLVAISAFLRPHEAVIAAETGHIAVHETGAIEATGHKVITKKTIDGKLNVALIHKCSIMHTDEHMVKPKLVYISNPTEVGTIYSKQEISEIYEYCQAQHLFLYIDGARLGSALMAKDNDMLLVDYPKHCDAFYIGGTKMGALFGEALVICNPNLKEDFRFMMKQKGALLVKGRILGIQFESLFKKKLYFEIGKHENEMADMLRLGISKLGYTFLYDSPSNQLFPVFNNDVIEMLSSKFLFLVWEKINETHSAVRLVTSWATTQEMVEKFLLELANFTDANDIEVYENE